MSDQVRSLDDAQAWLREHLAVRRHPFNEIDAEAAAETIDALEGIDPENWVDAWLGRSERFASQARAARSAEEERGLWWQAYQFAFLGRYPSPLHPRKRDSYAKAQEYFLRATALDEVPVERVEVPFAGRRGEGDSVVFYVSRPPGAHSPPAVMMWGGIDMWKEESWVRGALLRSKGFATIHIDMPGIGESPLLAGVDAERMWNPIFDWIGASDLDEKRIAALGQSFGGYWAMKLAITHRERVAVAVNWAGGVHETFQPSWQERSRNASSYLMDLMPTRASIFGGKTFEDYIARCPELSLLDQGLLDQPSAPLLLVNGIDDQQNSIQDIWLSLQHGDPKTARIFPGGHMGVGPVMPTVVAWLVERLQPRLEVIEDVDTRSGE
ncbi:MAG TPA: alpha/beta hydrolase [Microbacterium sp.]|uniref:alpha/beta hydrolase family protein n=1 Tax=Microbacterium sp. TaxID=51671 RepID=UPI002CE4404E|nr:alpha/beta hydrolase [Microbacterium sp.]HWI31478.1 alpha/beta hydrolase [Microbacterium sp.]